MNKPSKLTQVVKTGMLISGLLFTFATRSSAMQVDGYDPEKHDRFVSGFPDEPIPNASPNFSGDGYDWSGVAWSVGVFAQSSRQPFALLSPRHLVLAQHYNPANEIRILGRDQKVYTGFPGTLTNLGVGMKGSIFNNYDIAARTLAAPIAPPSQMARYPVLDLHVSSGTNNLANYHNSSLFHYGRGTTTDDSPRIALTNVASSGTTTTGEEEFFITSNRDKVQLEVGDSGGPGFHPWQKPNGEVELAYLGLGSTISSDNNFLSFLPSAAGINNTNELFTQTGFALRVVGNPSHTWSGNDSTEINRNRSWGIPGSPNATGATSDQFVLFDADSASSTTIQVNTNYLLRGLYFTGEDPFTFNHSNTLWIGRGGITNYSGAQQIFNAPLGLDDHQFWISGPGGLSIQNLDTNGKHLEIRAAGPVDFHGPISGSGSLALESGSLTLNGTHTYSGKTWVHEGTLTVNGSLASSEELLLSPWSELRGNGIAPAIVGSGTISPGPNPAILTAPSLDPQGEMEVFFQFTDHEHDFSSPGTSPNDLLRLTSSTPFLSPFNANHTIRLFLPEDIEPNEIYRGGFFTDEDVDFFAEIEEATILLYQPDPGGDFTWEGQNWSPYEAVYPITIETISLTANFGEGPVEGRILSLTVHPIISSYDEWTDFSFPPDTPAAEKEPEFDFANNGIPNLTAYALGIDPTNPDHSLLPHFSIQEDNDSLTVLFEHPVRKNATDLTYTIEVSTDLTNWDPWVPDTTTTDPHSHNSEEFDLQISEKEYNPPPERLFLRLRIEKMP